jgi:phage terminase small subunit
MNDLVVASPDNEHRRRVHLFVEAYLANGGNGTQAAITAGYPESSAHVSASRLLSRAKVRAAIEARRAVVRNTVEAETGVTVARLVAELAAIALFDPKDLYDDQGVMLPVHLMPEPARRALVSFSSKVEVIDAEDERQVTSIVTAKPRFHDKLNAITLLGRHLGGFVEKTKVEHAGKVLHGIDIDPGTASDGDLVALVALMKRMQARPVAGGKKRK